MELSEIRNRLIDRLTESRYAFLYARGEKMDTEPILYKLDGIRDVAQALGFEPMELDHEVGVRMEREREERIKVRAGLGF